MYIIRGRAFTSSTATDWAGQKIAFIPGQDAGVQRVIQAFKSVYPQLADTVLDTHLSDAAFDDAAQDGSYGSDSNPYVQMALVFTNLNSANNSKWEYTIRGNVSSDDPSESSALDTSDPFFSPLDNRYRDDGVQILGRQGLWLFLQDFMAQYILNQTLQSSAGARATINSTQSAYFQRPQVRLVPFPTVPYVYDSFAEQLGDYVGLLFVVAYRQLRLTGRSANAKRTESTVDSHEASLNFNSSCN